METIQSFEIYKQAIETAEINVTHEAELKTPSHRPRCKCPHYHLLHEEAVPTVPIISNNANIFASIPHMRVPYATGSYATSSKLAYTTELSIRRNYQVEKPKIPARDQEAANEKNQSAEEIEYEEHFKPNTYHESETGSFVVNLPFKNYRPYLGDSYTIALKIFHALERAFVKSPAFKEQYLFL
uniref:Uncharacterized protein n=1 Tax=Vespula pensylvanica TaxID=30213 RepID=A0A834JP38_VESPE|nr:hypothetical protein H0235_017491 [Vespula pensylvanica]